MLANFTIWSVSLAYIMFSTNDMQNGKGLMSSADASDDTTHNCSVLAGYEAATVFGLACVMARRAAFPVHIVGKHRVVYTAHRLPCYKMSRVCGLRSIRKPQSQISPGLQFAGTSRWWKDRQAICFCWDVVYFVIGACAGAVVLVPHIFCVFLSTIEIFSSP